MSKNAAVKKEKNAKIWLIKDYQIKTKFVVFFVWLKCHFLLMKLAR